MKRKNVILKYVIGGSLIGLLFPIIAVLICLFFLVEDSSKTSFFQLHRDFPLLIIIDLAPVVLALVAYVVGSSVNKSNGLFVRELNELNEKLLLQNNEKTTLLKEIHHRVKNNLQVITSLLSLQASFIEDEQTKGLFRYSQYRINSMAVIHEMLYQSGDISKINIHDYITSLVNGLLFSMKGASNHVTLAIDVSPDYYFNVDTAIPLGLIINEIMTNALKYGIKDDDSGTISVQLVKLKDPHYNLIIGDSGAGIPDAINFRTSNSLGLMLIHKLTLQLQGNIEMDNSKKGTNYTIHFQHIEQV